MGNLYSELMQLAYKAEQTPGSPESLTKDEIKVKAYEVKYSPALARQESQPAREFFGKDASVAGPRWATISFKVRMNGSGSSNTPPWADLLKACAWDFANGVFTPGHTSYTLTIGIGRDSWGHVLAGCMGTVKFVFTAGKPAEMEFTFTGVDQGDAAYTNLTGYTFAGEDAPNFAGATVALGDFTPVISKLEITSGEKVAKLEDAAADTGAGVADVSGRDAKATLDPLMVSPSTRNWYDKLVALDTEALSIAWGEDNGNKFTFTAPKAQVVKADDADRDKVATKSVELDLLPDEGWDEMELTCVYAA